MCRQLQWNILASYTLPRMVKFKDLGWNIRERVWMIYIQVMQEFGCKNSFLAVLFLSSAASEMPLLSPNWSRQDLFYINILMYLLSFECFSYEGLLTAFFRNGLKSVALPVFARYWGGIRKKIMMRMEEVLTSWKLVLTVF